jgi:hypothetical protein
MAERSKKSGGRKKKSDVIDVGDEPAKENSSEDSDAESEEEAEKDDEGLDTDLASSSIDVAPEESAGAFGLVDDVENTEAKPSQGG